MNKEKDGLGETTKARIESAVNFYKDSPENVLLYTATPANNKRYPLISDELSVVMKRYIESHYFNVPVYAIEGDSPFNTIGELQKFFLHIPENALVAIVTPWWHSARIKEIIRRRYPKRVGYVSFVSVHGNPLTMKICLTETMSWTLMSFPKKWHEPLRKLAIRIIFWRSE